MYIIHVTILIQTILAIFSLIQFIRLKRCKEEILYCHGKKSFTDIYKMLATYTWTNIIVVYWAVFLKLACQSIQGALSVMDIWLIVGTGIILLMILMMIVAITLYMTTEIKHLSPKDGIGKKLINIEDGKERNKAYKFYVTEVLVGTIMDITLLIQAFYTHIIIGILFILISIFLYYFGMADVLQHDNYNSQEYIKEYKKKVFLDKIFVTNVIRYFKDKDYHEKSISVLYENTYNIKKGFLYLFHR